MTGSVSSDNHVFFHNPSQKTNSQAVHDIIQIQNLNVYKQTYLFNITL